MSKANSNYIWNHSPQALILVHFILRWNAKDDSIKSKGRYSLLSTINQSAVLKYSLRYISWVFPFSAALYFLSKKNLVSITGHIIVYYVTNLMKQCQSMNSDCSPLCQLITPQRIIDLQRDLSALVTNIQTAADAKESMRRTELEEARRLR